MTVRRWEAARRARAVSLAAAPLALAGLRAAPPGGAARWARVNHRGATLTLLEGPAYAAGAVAGVLVPGVPAAARAGAFVAVGGAAALGALDDLAERRDGPASKGLRGHLGALARGQVTTGALKVLGIGVTGLVAAAVLPRRDPASTVAGRTAEVLADGALVAGAANLLNLLDLRPGRALKATLAVAPLLAGRDSAGAPLAAAAAGAAGGLLGQDLAERSMLGDTGANAAGALLGAAVVSGRSRPVRLGCLAVVVALTLASERVSFTRVIESTPGLRELDALGRRPR